MVMSLNAPFCKSVAPRLGECFLTIVEKHFTEEHLYGSFITRKIQYVLKLLHAII